MRLEDRSSCPHTFPNANPPDLVEKIITLRKEVKLTGDHIARDLKIPQRPVSRDRSQAKLSLHKGKEPKDEDLPR